MLNEQQIDDIIKENPNQGFDICSVCGGVDYAMTMDEINEESFDLICENCKH